MPIYEYTCRVCGAGFEHWHASIKDLATPVCPGCASAEVQRRLSAPAVRMGSGGSAGANEPASETTSKPGVFGRKELNAALRRQGIKPAKE